MPQQKPRALGIRAGDQANNWTVRYRRVRGVGVGKQVRRKCLSNYNGVFIYH